MAEAPKPLDYTTIVNKRPIPPVSSGFVGAIFGISPTIFAFAVVFALKGEHAVIAALFPYTMVAAIALEDVTLSHVSSLPILALALFQFPIYGAICGVSIAYGRFRKTLLVLFCVHASVVAACFLASSLRAH